MSLQELFAAAAASTKDPSEDVLANIASRVERADKRFETEAKQRVVDHKELAYSYSL